MNGFCRRDCPLSGSRPVPLSSYQKKGNRVTDQIKKPFAEATEEQKALRKAQADRLTRVMWSYICAAIALMSFYVGLGGSFIPPGFGILSCLLAFQSLQKGDRIHGVIAGAASIGAILIWLTANWPWIHGMLG